MVVNSLESIRASVLSKLPTLLSVSVTNVTQDCPFTNKKIEFELTAGQCFWLKGTSGCGKTSLINGIARLDKLPGAEVSAVWQEDIRQKEQIGVLFQQGVLLDTLNVYENIALARKTANLPCDRKMVRKYIKAVGLAESDGYKKPGQLSGGMLRRAALAQILAQQKHIIVLDEPFVGLDKQTAEGIIDLLNRLKASGQSFILITHESHYGQQLVTPGYELTLKARVRKSATVTREWLPKWRFSVRLLRRFGDYFCISLPMIIFAFIATGLAISMLSLQLMHKFDLVQILHQYISQAKLSFWQRIGYNLIAPDLKEMGIKYMPLLKKQLFQLVMLQSFVLQLSPLLTGLLLVGRIGGSYTGEIAMMQATKQNDLLRTLSILPRCWNLVPAAIAALLAAPLLTFAGTATALFVADFISSSQITAYHLYSHFGQFLVAIAPNIFKYKHFWSYPLVISIYRSLGFMIIILVVSEVAGYIRPKLQPRHVPKTITWSIVVASLLILLADWGFTEIYLNLPY